MAGVFLAEIWEYGIFQIFRLSRANFYPKELAAAVFLLPLNKDKGWQLSWVNFSS